MANNDRETWEIFRDDAERLLQEFETALLALESDPSDTRQVDELFRHLHTLKGSGGLLGLSALNHLAHQAEDLVDQIRDDKVQLHGGVVDALLNALDLFRIIVEESADGPDPRHGELVAPLCALLRTFKSHNTLRTEGPTGGGPDSLAAAPVTIKRISPQEALAASEAIGLVVAGLQDGAVGLPEAAREDVQKLAFTEKAFSIEGLSAAFQDFVATVDYGPQPVLKLLWRLLHRQVEAAAKGFVLFEDGPLAPGKDDPYVVGAFFPAVGTVLEPVLAAATSKNLRRDISALIRRSLTELGRLCRAVGFEDLDASVTLIEEAMAGSGDDKDDRARAELVRLVGRICALQDSWRSDTGLEVAKADDLRPWVDRLASSATSADARPKPEPSDADRRPAKPRDDGATTAAAHRNKFLRIKFDKVADLMSLTGEIGMAVGDVFGLPALQQIDGEEVRGKLDRLEGLIRELQDTSASLGLVPISSVFERMKRLGRDLSVQTGKRLALSIKGGDTEIDKLLVDALVDPLVHLLRNAADHGIESVEERQHGGKSEIASVQLSAVRQGEHVIITVQDDGRGMNREAIVEKAVAKGLVSADAAKAMPDNEVWQLVFCAGFTTASAVSNLSGRGVGMDVVRSAIHALGGQVSIRSALGQGTTVRLQLPLTLAFLDGMVVRVGRSMFVVPVSAVSRVFRVEDEHVVRVVSEGVDLMSVEGKMVPCLSLESFFANENTVNRDYTGRLMVVVRTTRGELAIPIDELVGNEQVTMKPMLGHLAKIRASAGCGLLRNGGVAIALNCERLYELGHPLAA